MRIYTSHLIGRNLALVLHGGGNTSVKISVPDLLGKERIILFVKGSGHDLASIGPNGFPGLILENLMRLRNLESLSDEEMANQLRINCIRADSPVASIEGFLHAFLPHKFVDHSHADALLVLANQPNGRKLVEKALGPNVVVIPYFKPGFDLSKAVADAYDSHPSAEAIVIMHHGIFTYGSDAETAYSMMIHYVNKAERFIDEYIDRSRLVGLDINDSKIQPNDLARLVETIRGASSFINAAGVRQRFFVEVRNQPELVKASLSPWAEELCHSGVMTPDHVTRTKNVYVFVDQIPDEDAELKKKIDTHVSDFRKNYDRYFESQNSGEKSNLTKLDNSPRVFLVAGAGLVALGFSVKWARIAADIAEHTIRGKLLAMAMGGYRPLPENHVFDLEYMNLQQQKLERTEEIELQGQIAVVTGAAGAIGFGIADCLLKAGAVVALTDLDETRLNKVVEILSGKYDPTRLGKFVFDITDYSTVEKAMVEIALRFGGIDLVVPNAGIAYVSKIEDMDPQRFTQVMEVNLGGVFNIIKAAIPAMKRQGTGGNIVLISSKNVFDPGAAFGAYSASKAAAHQISRIASLELAEMGIRVNMINPDAVFGTESVSSKLWDYIGPDRMKSRGLDPLGLKEYYRQRNLLKVSVLAEHVGNAVVFFAAEKTPTTGATLPVDGGVPAAAPR